MSGVGWTLETKRSTKDIMKNPEDYFTEDVMSKIEEKVRVLKYGTLEPNSESNEETFQDEFNSAAIKWNMIQYKSRVDEKLHEQTSTIPSSKTQLIRNQKIQLYYSDTKNTKELSSKSTQWATMTMPRMKTNRTLCGRL